MIATIAQPKMISLPNAEKPSAAISPPNSAPACDGAPSKVKPAMTSTTIAPTVVIVLARRTNAATIISTSAPTVTIISGRIAA